MLSSSCRNIMDRSVNLPVHRNIVVDGLNATGKYFLRNKWNLLVNEHVMTHQRL